MCFWGCFNPSGDLDLSGRSLYRNGAIVAFVSILLVIWICLEVLIEKIEKVINGGFNPSGDLDLSGSFFFHIFSIFSNCFNPSGDLDLSGRCAIA